MDKPENSGTTRKQQVCGSNYTRYDPPQPHKLQGKLIWIDGRTLHFLQTNGLPAYFTLPDDSALEWLEVGTTYDIQVTKCGAFFSNKDPE